MNWLKQNAKESDKIEYRISNRDYQDFDIQNSLFDIPLFMIQ